MQFTRVLPMAAVTAMALTLSACVVYTAPPRAHSSAGYPAQQYPAQQYPAQQYPAQQYPAQQYPAQQYPAQQYPAQQYPVQQQPAQQHPAQQGRVTNVEMLRVQQPSTSAGVGGAIVGGLVGGALGNQVGKGNGRKVATLAGVVGGAVAGNAIEKTNNPGAVSDVYRVTVQLDSGAVQSFDYPSAPSLRIGDRVRVENNQLHR